MTPNLPVALALLALSLPGLSVAQETVQNLCLPGDQTAQSGFTVKALKNIEYLSEWTASGKAMLTDGEYRESIAPGSASKIVVILSDRLAFGYTKDAQLLAAVILITDPGGSGTFYNLSIVVEQDGKPINTATALLGDRIKINSLVVEGDEIVVDMVIPGPDDPLCCPTQRVVQKYALQGDQLVQIPSVVGTVWQWVSTQSPIEKTTVNDSDKYTIEFLPGGEVRVQADCNVAGGTYTISDSQIKIMITTTTLAACPPGSLGDQFIKELLTPSIVCFKD